MQWYFPSTRLHKNLSSSYPGSPNLFTFFWWMIRDITRALLAAIPVSPLLLCAVRNPFKLSKAYQTWTQSFFVDVCRVFMNEKGGKVFAAGMKVHGFSIWKQETLYIILHVISHGLLSDFCCDCDISGMFSAEPTLLDLYFFLPSLTLRADKLSSKCN